MRTPFFARVGENWYLIDLNERVSRTLYLFGEFEPAIAGLIPRLIKPGSNVFDVGANFGYFSILAARAAGPGGKVYAFEPDPRNIQRLQSNIQANSLTTIETVPFGAFDRSGHISFHLASDSEDNLGSSSIVDESTGRHQIQIPIITLDEFASSRNIDHIDLMKLDIEGAELEALAGAEKLLSGQKVRNVLVEVHLLILGVEKASSLPERFTRAGYRAWLVREGAYDASSPTESLQPLSQSSWLEMPNPHLLFTSENIVGK